MNSKVILYVNTTQPKQAEALKNFVLPYVENKEDIEIDQNHDAFYWWQDEGDDEEKFQHDPYETTVRIIVSPEEAEDLILDIEKFLKDKNNWPLSKGWTDHDTWEEASICALSADPGYPPSEPLSAHMKEWHSSTLTQSNKILLIQLGEENRALALRTAKDMVGEREIPCANVKQDGSIIVKTSGESLEHIMRDLEDRGINLASVKAANMVNASDFYAGWVRDQAAKYESDPEPFEY